MFIGALTLAVLAFIPVILAEGNLTGLLQALNSSGLDQFANATTFLNGSSIGERVLAQLSRGNNTIFAPTDSALSGLYINNLSCLADIVSYHIVPGNFINETGTSPNVTIGRTLLNDSSLVTLEGNQSQVLVWSKYPNGTIFIKNVQGYNTPVVNTTRYNDTAILAIDSVLAIPPNISTILSNESYNLTAVAGVLQSTHLPNSSSLTLLDALSSARGITIFAPNNAGLQAAQSSIAGISGNMTALQNVLENHIINGSSVYHTEIHNGTSLTSAGGQNYAFVTNSTGSYVSIGGSNQVQIVQTNVLTSNGVIHVINGVMLDTNSNVALASSAYVSATSVAARTTQVGPVVAPSPTLTPTSTTTSGAMLKDATNDWKLGVLAGVVAALGQLA